jgi:regulatory protein
MRWLASREHSRQELRAKLLRWADECEGAAQVDALLDELASRGHLSEARFVESRVRVRSQRFGNRRIELELRQHGVAPDPALQDQLRRSELARAREVWRKRFGEPAATPAERAKQMRFLAARGFSGEVVRTLVADPNETDAA